MKLGEMADFLTGLANALERFLGKIALKDLLDLADGLRLCKDESVASFANQIRRMRDAKPGTVRRAAGLDEYRLGELANRIRDYRAQHHRYDYAQVKILIREVEKLTVPNLKALGERIGCPLTGNKSRMLMNLESWLTNLKRTADQASFTLTSTAPDGSRD